LDGKAIEDSDPGASQMIGLIQRFVRDESGATAIEYALIAAGIGIAIIAAVNTLGTAISNKFGSITTSLGTP
jgi:pilus assembly protein Flp/PilA